MPPSSAQAVSISRRVSSWFAGVARHRQAADVARDRLGGVRVDVVDDHLGAGGGEVPGQRRADAAAGAGDHDPLHWLFPVNVTPPSITRVCPVIQAASGPQRNATAPATSSGTPSRPSG